MAQEKMKQNHAGSSFRLMSGPFAVHETLRNFRVFGRIRRRPPALFKNEANSAPCVADTEKLVLLPNPRTFPKQGGRKTSRPNELPPFEIPRKPSPPHSISLVLIVSVPDGHFQTLLARRRTPEPESPYFSEEAITTDKKIKKSIKNIEESNEKSASCTLARARRDSHLVARHGAIARRRVISARNGLP